MPLSGRPLRIAQLQVLHDRLSDPVLLFVAQGPPHRAFWGLFLGKGETMGFVHSRRRSGNAGQLSTGGQKRGSRRGATLDCSSSDRYGVMVRLTDVSSQDLAPRRWRGISLTCERTSVAWQVGGKYLWSIMGTLWPVPRFGSLCHRSLEMKPDDFGFILLRDGDRVRTFTRRA